MSLWRKYLGEPVFIPRWALVIQYAFFVLLGAAINIATSPSFSIIAPGSWSSIWAVGIQLSAIGALIGSIKPKWEPLERWAALLLVALLFGYAFAPIELLLRGDATRTTYSAMALILSILPTARVASLVFRAGRKHELT